MLRIRYSDRALDIEGSEQDYKDLCNKIDKLIDGYYTSAIAVLCDSDFDPYPYHKSCAKIRIVLGSGRNEFNVNDSMLKIEGSAIALKNFSDNFPIGIEEDKGEIRYHHHYDTYSFPEYIAEDSPNIVLSLRG